MKKIFPILLVVVGLAFLAGGIYATARGLDAKEQVRSELLAQNITTTEDATIPNARVDDAATADAMADIIGVHALEATGGLRTPRWVGSSPLAGMTRATRRPL